MERFIDLFCGIGGFRVAMESFGLKCVFSSEINKTACKAYEANFGEAPSGDITKVAASDIPPHDIICGGFPCQPFSIAGKRLSSDDPRGNLFLEIIRIAKHHRPKLLILENVAHILIVNGGSYLETIEQELNGIGYNLYYGNFNASLFGVPQTRERVYFVAVRDDIDKYCELPHGTYEKIYLENIMEDEVDKRLYVKRDDLELNVQPWSVEYDLKPIRIGQFGGNRQGYRVYSLRGHAITQCASGGGMGANTGLYYTDKGVRKLSITECKRVMGFPDGHIVSDTFGGAYRQLGNAVAPPVVREIAKTVLNSL